MAHLRFSTVPFTVIWLNPDTAEGDIAVDISHSATRPVSRETAIADLAVRVAVLAKVVRPIRTTCMEQLYRGLLTQTMVVVRRVAIPSCVTFYS